MKRAILMLLTLIGSRAAIGQDSVVLREWARLPARGPVTLGAVADLTGEQALALGGMEIPVTSARPIGDGWSELDVRTVRDAIRSAPGINWGRLVVRGSTCSIRRAAQSEPGTALKPERRSAPAADEPTVRGLVAARLREAIGGDADEVRFTFEDSDGALLDTPVVGRTADVQLVGTSDRQTVTVRLFEGLKVVASGTVRVGISVRRTVAVCGESLHRGDSILAEHVTTEERWVPPSVRPADPEQAVGRIVRSKVGAGEIIELSDAEAPLMIKKGDLVDVYCLAGSINLKSVARATENGREGETIRFQTPGGSRSILARVDGPGRAVTGVGALPGPAPSAEEAVVRTAPQAGREARSTGDVRAKRVKYVDLGNRPIQRAGPGPREGLR